VTAGCRICRLFLHYLGQAEVQAVFSDGAVSLHTRSLKYGKVSWALAIPVC
jgi:exosome complex RNA-binding protein Rrp4